MACGQVSPECEKKRGAYAWIRLIFHVCADSTVGVSRSTREFFCSRFLPRQATCFFVISCLLLAGRTWCGPGRRGQQSSANSKQYRPVGRLKNTSVHTPQGNYLRRNQRDSNGCCTATLARGLSRPPPFTFTFTRTRLCRGWWYETSPPASCHRCVGWLLLWPQRPGDGA